MLGRHCGVDQLAHALDSLNRAVVDLSAKVDSKRPTQGTRLPRWDGPTWARLILPSTLIRDVGIVSRRSENLSMTLRVVWKLVMFLVGWLPACLAATGVWWGRIVVAVYWAGPSLWLSRSVMGEAAEKGSPPTPEASAFQGAEMTLHRVTSAAVA